MAFKPKYTTAQRDKVLQMFDRRTDLTPREIAEKNGVTYGITLKWIGQILKSRMQNKPA